MAVSSIVWNGITLSLPRVASAWTHDIAEDRVESMAADGHRNSHHRGYLWRVHFLLKGPLEDTVERDLWNWWAWAMMGNYYAVAFDSTKTLNTTLDDAAAASQKNVPLTATTTAASGDLMIMTKADRSYYELFKVDTVDAGVKLVSTTNLCRAFAAGDSCRHLQYLPRVVSLDRDPPISVEGKGRDNSVYLDHVFEEDLA